MSSNWIQTSTGRKFFPTEPNPGEIVIEDIAHALSYSCRYNGHTSTFYSVAEHSVHVDDLVARRGGSLEEHRWALLHDASEAYLCDIPRPLKRMPEMQPYRDAEKQLQMAIVTHFGLDPEQPAIVTEMDSFILGTEARQLMWPVHPDWYLTCPGGRLPDEDSVLSQRRLGWPSAVAETLFRHRFSQLFGAP
jgi:hypothetical protein